MKAIAAILPLAALAGLAACSVKDDGKDGATVSINAKGDTGDVAINADGQTGKVSVKIPGFDANVKLPKMMLDHSNFDLGGVKLYPGSKITTVNVNADDRGNANQANVRVAFDSPTDPAKVKAWFKKGFEDEGFTFTETPAGFTGKTDDGDDFSIALTANGAATGGTIDISDKGR